MSYGFEVGCIYNRRRDIHARFGGQQRGGIITPARPGSPIFIVSGARGEAHGYLDKWRDDVFEYYGMGQVGNMEFRTGTKAIRDHVENGRSLLLFAEVNRGRSGLQFVGEMIVDGYLFRETPDREGNSRQAIVFELRRLENVSEKVDETDLPTDDLEMLRALAFAAAAPSQAIGVSSRTIYQRSADVKAYVLARAKGICNGCDQPAPFKRSDGAPYLEPHHIRRASDGGPDDPRFVIALCPNCHRRVHAGEDGPAFNTRLLTIMPTIEPKA